jgi:hypothetical protein
LPDGARMTVRTRKLIGTIGLLALVIVWALLAMAFAQVLVVHANGFVKFAYYALVGMGWVLPAMPLVSWMSRPEKPAQPNAG